MPNYRDLYIELYRATEKAIALLREAQESFETQYMAEFNPEQFSLYSGRRKEG